MVKVTVKKITYKNELLRSAIFISEEGDTYKGYFPIIEEGFGFNLDCTSEFNHTYNREEYLVKQCSFPIIDDSSKLIELLSADFLTKTYKNKTAIDFGTVLAIENKIGLKYLDIFRNSKETIKILSDVELTESFKKQVNALSENLGNLHKSYETYNYLIDYGFESDFSAKISFSEYRFFRQHFEKNPYELLDYFECEWHKFDNVVLQSGVTLSTDVREEGALLYVLAENSRLNSDICSSVKDVFRKMPSLLKRSLTNESFTNLIVSMRKKKLIFEDIDDNIYSWGNYHSEDLLAYNLLRLNKEKKSSELKKIEKATDSYKSESDKKLTLATTQEEAVNGFLKHHVSILLGPAGSGKTTTLKEMINLISIYEKSITKLEGDSLKQHIEQNILLVAPTGMAKERMRVTTDYSSNTIHSVLGLSPVYLDATYNSTHKLSQKYIFVDEMSMVDTILACKLLEGVDSKSTIVFIGDTNQLPSIGPGRVLFELVNSGKIPVFELDCIFRQGDDSNILGLSQGVAYSERQVILESLQTTGKELLVVHEKNKNQIKEKLMSLVKGLLNVPSIDFYKDVQIISPMNVSELGTRNLNLLVQELFMKEKKFKFNKKSKFNLNDKVMQLLNDGEKGVFNGQIGRIIFLEANSIKVQFNEGKIVEYTKQEASIHLEISYVTSIHKMQGSEAKIIIMMCHLTFKRMLDKTLLYTGVTRAKERLVLIGDMDSFINGAMLDKTSSRKSNIRLRMTDNELKAMVNKK